MSKPLMTEEQGGQVIQLLESILSEIRQNREDTTSELEQIGKDLSSVEMIVGRIEANQD